MNIDFSLAQEHLSHCAHMYEHEALKNEPQLWCWCLLIL